LFRVAPAQVTQFSVPNRLSDPLVAIQQPERDPTCVGQTRVCRFNLSYQLGNSFLERGSLALNPMRSANRFPGGYLADGA
jgi:hypothetical protein